MIEELIETLFNHTVERYLNLKSIDFNPDIFQQLKEETAKKFCPEFLYGTKKEVDEKREKILSLTEFSYHSPFGSVDIFSKNGWEKEGTEWLKMVDEFESCIRRVSYPINGKVGISVPIQTVNHKRTLYKDYIVEYAKL